MNELTSYSVSKEIIRNTNFKKHNISADKNAIVDHKICLHKPLELSIFFFNFLNVPTFAHGKTKIDIFK